MDTKYRPEEDRQQDRRDHAADLENSSGEDLNQAARKSEDLIAKANEAIRKALSSDSAKFLASSRQTGGQ